MSFGESDVAIEMSVRDRDAVGFRIQARHFICDQEAMDGAFVVSVVELLDALGERFEARDLGKNSEVARGRERGGPGKRGQYIISISDFFSSITASLEFAFRRAIKSACFTSRPRRP